MTRPKPRAGWETRIFFALLAVVYVSVFPYQARTNNPNENVRTYMTMAIVEEHTFCIDNINRRYGWTNDQVLIKDPTVPGGGHRFSVKAPLVSYMGVPIYWVFTKVAPLFGHPVPTDEASSTARVAWLRDTTWVLRVFAVQLPCFVFLVFLERWLRRVTADVVLRLTAVAAVGLGTNYLAYALMNVSHALFAVTAFAAFALTMEERERFLQPEKRRLGRAFLVGLFAGSATMLDYQALPVSGVVALYGMFVFRKPTRLAMLALGGTLCVLGLMFFQWRAFGDPLTPGHKMVESTLFATRHHEGFWGIQTPVWEVFRDLSINLGFGFFGTSPYMWLGLLAIPFAVVLPGGRPAQRRRRRVASYVWMFAMLTLWLALSAANNWRGGWTIGPRLLGAAPPFFAFGAVCALERMAGHSPTRRAVMRGAAGALATMAVLQTGLISVLFNSMPESVTRPMTQIAIPLLRAGFAPYDLAWLVGWHTTGFFYFVVGCLVLAPLFAAFLRAGEGLRSYVVRVVTFLVVGAAAAYVVLRPVDPLEGGDGTADLAMLAADWEPAGRDRISLVRIEAERHGARGRGPCFWYKLADLERIVHWDARAAGDEVRAKGAPRSSCP